MISTTQNRIKFINASDPNDVELNVQFVPQEIDFTRGIRVEDIPIIGRNLPFYQYVNGSKEVSLELDFHTEEEGGQDVLGKIRWLEQKTYNETFEKGACSLLIQMGEMFSNMKWVIKSFSYKYIDFDDTKNFAPRRAKANITLCQEETDNGVKRSNYLNNF